MSRKKDLLNRISITYTEEKDKFLLVIVKQLFRNTQMLNMWLLVFFKASCISTMLSMECLTCSMHQKGISAGTSLWSVKSSVRIKLILPVSILPAPDVTVIPCAGAAAWQSFIHFGKQTRCGQVSQSTDSNQQTSLIELYLEKFRFILQIQFA